MHKLALLCRKAVHNVDKSCGKHEEFRLTLRICSVSYLLSGSSRREPTPRSVPWPQIQRKKILRSSAHPTQLQATRKTTKAFVLHASAESRCVFYSFHFSTVRNATKPTRSANVATLCVADGAASTSAPGAAAITSLPSRPPSHDQAAQPNTKKESPQRRGNSAHGTMATLTKPGRQRLTRHRPQPRALPRQRALVRANQRH